MMTYCVYSAVDSGAVTRFFAVAQAPAAPDLPAMYVTLVAIGGTAPPVVTLSFESSAGTAISYNQGRTTLVSDSAAVDVGYGPISTPPPGNVGALFQLEFFLDAGTTFDMLNDTAWSIQLAGSAGQSFAWVVADSAADSLHAIALPFLFTRSATVSGPLTVTGSTTLAALSAQGAGTFAGGLSVHGLLNVNASTTIGGALSVGGPIVPSVGHSAINGIQFPSNPGGGGGDEAFLRYSVTTGETTQLTLGINNDADDALVLWQAGAGRLTIANNLVRVANNMIVNGTVSWGETDTRTEYRNDAGSQGNAGARSGFYQTQAPVNFPPGASSWWHLLDVRHSNPANNFALQIAGAFFDQKLWFRKTDNSPSSAWRQFVGADANGNVGMTVRATGLSQHHDGNGGVNPNSWHQLVLCDNGAWNGNYNRLYLHRDDGTYGNEIHVKFADNITSSRTAKVDIIPIPAQKCLQLLEEIMATQLVHYRLRCPADLEDDVVHLGIIAEDAPDEIVNTDRTSLEIGDYCALLMAGIKALKLDLDALRATVNLVNHEHLR